METTRKTMKKRVRRSRYALAKAAVSFACLIAILGGMILESLPMPVAYSLESALICGKQEHVHGDGCWTQQLVCTEENHEHSDACYENTLTCGYEEHIHSAGCYAAIEATAAVQEEPAEAPVQADEPATPEKQEKPAPTPAETPAPEETATLEPAMEETTAPTQTTEPTSEATAEPTAEAELVLKNLTISSATAKAGESVRWGFECANAEKITYAIFDAAGAQAASGEVSAEHVIEWTATAAGVYTIVVIAVRGDQQAQLEGSIQVEAVASDVLAVSAHSEQRYAFAGKDALVFDTSVSGGAAPVDVEYEIRVNDQTVYTHSGFEAQISYMPQEFGVHTLTMTATDANGQQASATYSIPVAVEEREHASDWERTFANVKLTGNFAEDILAIARTQLGYSESERDFIIDEDDVQHGYTRYGAWYGASYSEWCAMFVSFCAHYAQIPEKYLPQAANCAKWKKNLDKLYLDDEDSYAPEVGDLIFFHYNRTEDQRPESEKEKNVPNHVGIVTGTDKNYIYTIEGNSAGRVRECRYEWGDEHIVGYVSMAEIMRLANPETATPAETKAPAEPEAPGETAAPTETVTPTETKEPFDGAAYVRIVGRSVNLRAEASVDSESLGHANQDDMFRVDGQVENEIGEIWYCVFYGESFAYVRSDLAEAHEAAAESEPEEPDAPLAFERLPYEGDAPEGMEMLDNGLLHYADDEGEIYLVYGRYGEGEAQFYLCDAEGVPFGADAGFGEIAPLAASLAVSVKTDRTSYTNADGENVVTLTIRIVTNDDGQLKKDKTLTLTLTGAGNNLTVDSISTTNGAFGKPSVSGNEITVTATSDVKKQNTVTVVCHYTIPADTKTGGYTASVKAYETGKKSSGSGSASYNYTRYTGVRISAVDVPDSAYAWGETVDARVRLRNFDASANTVTKLVVKDGNGNAVCTLENLEVPLSANGTAEIPFRFAAPDAGYDSTAYTVEAVYGDGASTTNVENFSIALPASPKLTTEKKVSVVYDNDDNASFGSLKVTVTNNLAGTGNSNNAGNIQMRGADGNWTQIDDLSGKSISGGDFTFDLNGKLTPDQVLNNPLRVELTRANGSTLNTRPQSEWFYLTDSLPKPGFRGWVLDPANGCLNADGTFNGNMNALAEAYKKYSRLALTVTSDVVSGKAGETVELPIRVQSDEAMEAGGVIELTLKDGAVSGAIALDGCEAASEYGTIAVQNGRFLLTLNRRMEAGEAAAVTVKAPMNYSAEMGAHAIAIDAKYTDAGEVKKQGQGEGTINVTAGDGWHILSVESPSDAVILSDEATYTLKIRNFDPQSVTLQDIQAALEGTGLEITGIRAGETDVSMDVRSVVIPAATGEGADYRPGDLLLQLRVKAPDTVMDVTPVSFTLTDANGHSETAEGTLSVRRPYAPMPVETVKSNQTSMTVRKTWVDNNNNEGRRPEKIYVQLQMNGEATGEPVELSRAQADKNGDWVYTWSELPYRDTDGKVIDYSVVENVSGEGMQWYDARYDGVERIEGREASTKWLKADAPEGSAGVKYALYADGAIMNSSFNDKVSAGVGKCDITEGGVRYTSELTSPSSVPDSTQWELIGGNGSYQLKCNNRFLVCDRSGNISLSGQASNYSNWSLDSRGRLSIQYQTKDEKQKTKYIKLNGGKVEFKDDSNKATAFTLFRKVDFAAENDTYSRQITNVYKNPNARTSLTVRKNWAHNGAFLHMSDSVEMTLCQNGEPMQINGQEVKLTLNAAGQWSGEFTDLPMYEVIDEDAGLMEKYVYTVRETKIKGYIASGEDDVTFIPNSDSPAEGHYEVTVTNTRDQAGYTATKPDTSVHKRIDYLGDGGSNPDTALNGDDDYRLYLDFTGASEPVDILFVIDTTGSMRNSMGGKDSTQRQTVVSNLMNDTNGRMGFLNQAITMNPKNNVAVMLFSGPVYDSAVNGRPYQDNKADCQYIMLNWTSGGQRQGTNNYNYRKTGTYYDPAIMRAREMFADPAVAGNGHRKVMIFMTDGEPNGYIDENLTYQTSSFTVASGHILQRMDDFKAEFPNIDVYTVGISQDTTSSKTLLTAMTAGSGSFFQADDTAGLTEGLTKIMDSLKPRNVVITDNLSANAMLNTAQPELKITRTDTNTGKVDVIWTGNSVGANGNIGSAAAGYAGIIQTVRYAASQAEDSTGSITVTFNPSLLVDSQYTYTLSYNVKPTGAAYQYTDTHDEYEFEGDADTDYGANGTSSGKPGLLANKDAKAAYTASDREWHDDYPHPVLQTARKTTAIAAPEAFKTVRTDGARPEDSAIFLFSIEAVEPEDAPMPILEGRAGITASWVYDAEQETPATSGAATPFGEVTFDRTGTYQYRITETPGETEGWTYDDAVYLWTVTVTRQADNSLKAEGVLTRDGEPAERAEFVNEYAGDLPLTIVKSDSTDHDKRLSGAAFSLYSDAECTADSLVTVYADAEKTKELTHFTTAGDSGEITVYGLKPGTYYLKESAAPGGYCLIEGALAISVEKDGITTSGDPQRIAIADGKVVVYDSPIYDIPSTGGRGTWMFHAAGLALMLLAAAFTATRRRERGSGAKR